MQTSTALDTQDFSPAAGNNLDRVSTLLIGGKWIQASENGVIKMIAPATGKTIGAISAGLAADVDMAVAAARKALNEGEWGRTTAAERGRLLTALSVLVREEADRIARIEAHDTGKPISVARNDMLVLARYLEFYGGAADKVHGQIIPFERGYNVSVVRERLGVTAHIIPWNYPAQMFGRSLAPALAMGNATVMKPSEDACLACLEVARLAEKAGFPPGAINIVTGYGAVAGAALAAHPDVNLVTFTGSSEVGELVQKAAARHHVPVSLELGGKSPQVVFADADLEAAANSVVKAITQNAGQTCSAGSRVLVEQSVFDAFMDAVGKRFMALTVGVPDSDCDVGPVINAKQQARIKRYVEESRAAGAPVIAETRLPDALPKDGFYVAPIVFGPVQASDRIAREEIFGPVLCALAFKDEAEALRLANDTEYGLVAAVWTRDGDRQARLSKQILAGQCFINCYGAGGGVELPFGGMKRSGHGREKGMLALEEMSTTRTIVHYHG